METLATPSPAAPPRDGAAATAPPDPGPAPAPVTLHRRRGVLLLARATAFFLMGAGPILALLPLVAPMHGNAPAIAVVVGGGLLLAGAGAYLKRASHPDWLRLCLDADGATVLRGGREQAFPWADLTAIEATSRQNGRNAVPTVRLRDGGGRESYLDDVYTLRPAELARAMRAFCRHAGNEWPSMPPAPKPLLAKRSVRYLVLPAIALGLAGIIAIRVLFR